MAFVDDPNQNTENVAGAAPLSQGQATAPSQAESAPTQGDSSPSTIQSSGSTAPKTTNKSGKASSGMFTNIQNYVAKNQPQAQKMAESTLGEIRKANEASKTAQKNALSQFSGQTEQGGLHDTAARKAELEAYTRSQAGMAAPTPQATPQATPRTDVPVQQQQSMKDAFYASDPFAAQGIAPKIGQIYNPDTKSYEFESQQTIDGKMTELSEEDRDRRKITNPYEGKVAGDTSIRQTQDEWGRFNGSEEYTVTQDMIDNWNNPVRTSAADAVSDQNLQPKDITEDMFANILNAKYQGPRNLTETGNIYSQLQKQAQKSADMGQLTQTDQGRSQLMTDLNTRGGRQYGAGMSKLDSMLMGQQTDQLQNIMSAGKEIGSSQDIMRNVGQQAQDVASGRAAEVMETQRQGREAFQQLSQERQGQVDQRVGDVVDNWDKLPDHYKGIFSKPDGSIDLSAIEAATLGMDDSTRLFNVRDRYGVDELFGGVEADKTRLISKDEQGNLARLQALSNLATGMDGEKLYDIGDYSNADIAGSQSAFDALNLGNFADKLEQTEKDFQKDIDKTQTGQGHKKVSRGNAFGKKTKHYYASAQDKLGNQLAQQQDNAVSQIMANNPDMSQEDAQAAAQSLGYGYKAGDIERLDTNPDLLANLANLSKDYNLSSENGKINLDTSSYKENEQGDALDMSDAGMFANPNYAAAALLGREGVLGDFGESLFNFQRGLMDAPEKLATSMGDSLKDSNLLGDVSQISGNIVSEIGAGLGSIANSFGGINTSDMKKFGSAIAQNQANTNLLNKLKSEQSRLGASNVARVANTEETNQRTNALLDILKNLDTTNK